MQKQLFIFFVLLILVSCANPGIPTGGPVDSEAPEIIKATPENKKTGLRPYVIQVEFNEYVVLKDLQNQLIISPPIEPKPVIKVKNKTVNIDLSDCVLKENTTYVMNFGNAIVDFTEGNPVRGYTYVFSTGSYIDSSSISGTAMDAFTLEKKEGISIQLYKNLSDTAVYKTKPDYVTKTDASGHYELNYLAPGKYRLYAIEDKNKNYLLNKDEKIGFISEIIELDSTLNNIELRYYLEEAIPKVTSAQQVSKEVFKFGFNLKVAGLLKSIEPIGGTVKNKRNLTYTRFFSDKDTAYFYTPDYIFDGLDSVSFRIWVEDSMYIITSAVNNKLGYQPLELKVEETRIAPTDSLVFETHSPLRMLREGQVIINDITDTVQVTNYVVEQVYEDQFKFYIKSNWVEGHSYQVILLDSMLVDIYGSYSAIKKDTLLKQNFTVKKEEETGTLNIKLVLPKLDTLEAYNPDEEITTLMVSPSTYIIQLVDSRDNVEMEFTIDNLKKLEHNLILKYLTPKEYKIKIIREVNNINGKWDGGYLTYFMQPEMVFYYSKTLTVRANWELDGITITLPAE